MRNPKIIGKVKVMDISYNDLPVYTADELGAELIETDEMEITDLHYTPVQMTRIVEQDLIKAQLLELYNRVCAERDQALEQLTEIKQRYGV